MNINALRDNEADLCGFYAAACGSSATGWPGCVIYRSRDGGGSYSPIGVIDAPAIVGVAYSYPEPHPSHPDTIDWSNSITVETFRGELSSCTYAQLLEGRNAFVLNDEVMGFMNAELLDDLGDGHLYYKLTGLFRGRRGTEYAMYTHNEGTGRFVMLGLAFKFIELDTSDIGKELLVKPVTRGSNLSLTSSQGFQFDGATFMPYAPVQLRAIRNPSTNDITINWVRRNRKLGAWRDGVDVPNSEASESYEIVIYATSGFSTIKRTLTSTSPTVTYTSAQQVTDFGSNQATIHVKVYQMSAIVGRGRPATASI